MSASTANYQTAVFQSNELLEARKEIMKLERILGELRENHSIMLRDLHTEICELHVTCTGSKHLIIELQLKNSEAAENRKTSDAIDKQEYRLPGRDATKNILLPPIISKSFELIPNRFQVSAAPIGDSTVAQQDKKIHGSPQKFSIIRASIDRIKRDFIPKKANKSYQKGPLEEYKTIHGYELPPISAKSSLESSKTVHSKTRS